MSNSEQDFLVGQYHGLIKFLNVVASKPVAARTANEVAMLNALSKGLCEASRIEVIFIMETALNEDAQEKEEAEAARTAALKAAPATKPNSKPRPNFAGIKAEKGAKPGADVVTPKRKASQAMDAEAPLSKKSSNKAAPAPARKAPLKAATKPTPKPASKPVAKKTPVTKKKELSTEFVDPLSDDDTAMEITVEEDEGDDVKVEEVGDGEEEGAEAEEQSEPEDEDATYVDEELPVPAPSRMVSLRTGSSKYTARRHSAANE